MESIQYLFNAPITISDQTAPNSKVGRLFLMVNYLTLNNCNCIKHELLRINAFYPRDLKRFYKHLLIQIFLSSRFRGESRTKNSIKIQHDHQKTKNNVNYYCFYSVNNKDFCVMTSYLLR